MNQPQEDDWQKMSPEAQQYLTELRSMDFDKFQRHRQRIENPPKTIRRRSGEQP